MEVFAVENLTFSYPNAKDPTLHQVSFAVEAGELAVLCGETGSGKSTLLRLCKPQIAPLGDTLGEILYRGTPLSKLPLAESAVRIGYVMQNPEQQIVTDKVWHELAFGLENMGLPQAEIARRVAEMASYFGIDEWFEKSVSELSGGQKQLLSLASVMVMNPDVLILDEPTAQLDPIAASELIGTVRKLNSDFALTVIIAEHRLEELIPVCDRLILLERGSVTGNGAPHEVVRQMASDSPLLAAMPSATRLYHALRANGECPLTLRAGRRLLERYSNRIDRLPEEAYTHSSRAVLELRDVCFRYERALPDVLCSAELTAWENEILCILGGNGSGKSTLLGVAAGLLRPYSGSVRVFGKPLRSYQNQSLYRECLSLLPQDVGTVFLRNTVREELADAKADPRALPFDLSHLYDRHPYDLSGGEMQLVALAKVLATKPRLLLLDEPTKGLDAGKKAEMIGILRALKANGVTVVIVTHDVEFSALAADRCVLFFRGQAVSFGEPNVFFSENRFYTTAACRMNGGYYRNCATVEALAALCRLNEEAEHAYDSQ